MSPLRYSALIAASLALSAAPTLATTIANGATGASISPFGPLGNPNGTPTYGEVFVSPVAGNLTSFTFWLGGNVGQIRGVVSEWNGGFNYGQCTAMFPNQCGTGATLYDSGLQTVAPSGPVTFALNVPILSLTKYVAFISVFGNPNASGQTTLELGDNSSTALRYFVFNEGPSDPRNNPSWNFDQDLGDARFSATIANVPEPAVWGLMILGFALTGAVARRRRRGTMLAA